MPHAIAAEHLTKQYTIGQLAHETMLRDAIVRLVRHPFRRRSKDDMTVWALQDVSFAVETGGVVGIIGRNGSGKSTLLKILSRITWPTSGTISVQGRVAALLEVGTGFHEELTGRENIYLNGSVLGMKKRDIDAQLDEIIDFAGVGRFIDTPIKRYSSGMRLRLGFAVAAHLRTDVLLVDEVLAVGDAEFQKKCLSKIENLHRGGRTVLFVSHNMAAIEHLCPRTIWIHEGKVRQDGETEEVIRAYLEHFADGQCTGSNLDEISDRQGTGEVRFTGIKFLDEAGRPKPVIRSGDAVTVRLYYRASTDLQNAQFGIGLFTERAVKVAVIGTVAAGYQIPLLPSGDSHIDVTYEFLNLMPGRYSISLWATGPNHFHSEENSWDILDNCATLDVEPSDFYKSGSGVGPTYGIVLLPCRWNLGNGAMPREGTVGAPRASRFHGDQAEAVTPMPEMKQ
ncbi:MAG TPA: ABC transporter ATP-binding protein [Patescibacteria group bacterium]|nr:ABC transporter ATP-binding protein [Patescibacteria group bacterium]